ncbi:hypothetical protein [Nonomuraea sp. NPDC050643]|uniref:hypothetical protein n=1 Tax=Nonomuraea sp. NPDC050643 TaxID=3155660 RepID=UPI0033CB4CDB
MSSATQEVVLDVDGLRMRYGTTDVLHDVNFRAYGTAAQLARQIAGEDEVRWTHDGQSFRQATTESTRFVVDLVGRHGETIENLEVRRASLEDTYLSLVRRAEAGPGEAADVHELEEVAR